MDKVSQWIKCSDRLPEAIHESGSSKDVLFVCKGIMYAGCYSHTYGTWQENADCCGCCAKGLYPTHWMPLPKLPEDIE